MIHPCSITSAICPKCQHVKDTPGICNCNCHPDDSIAGQFRLSHNGMEAVEFMETQEFKTGGQSNALHGSALLSELPGVSHAG